MKSKLLAVAVVVIALAWAVAPAAADTGGGGAGALQAGVQQAATNQRADEFFVLSSFLLAGTDARPVTQKRLSRHAPLLSDLFCTRH